MRLGRVGVGGQVAGEQEGEGGLVGAHGDQLGRDPRSEPGQALAALVAGRGRPHEQQLALQASPRPLLAGEEDPGGACPPYSLVVVADREGGGRRGQEEVSPLDERGHVACQAGICDLEGLVVEAGDEQELTAVGSEVRRAHPGAVEAASRLVELSQRLGQVAAQVGDEAEGVQRPHVLEALVQQPEELPRPPGVLLGPQERASRLMDACAVQQRARFPQRVAVLAEGCQRAAEVCQRGVVAAEVEAAVRSTQQHPRVEQPGRLPLGAVELQEATPAPPGNDQGGAQCRADVDGPIGVGRGACPAQSQTELAYGGPGVAAVAVHDPGCLVGVRRCLRVRGAGQHRGRPPQRVRGARQGECEQVLAVLRPRHRSHRAGPLRHLRRIATLAGIMGIDRGELMDASAGPGPRRPRRRGKGKDTPLTPEQARERVRVQVKIIRDAMGRDTVGVALPKDSDDVADYLYLYRQGVILVRDEDVDRVSAALDQQVRVQDSLVGGVTLLTVLTGEDVPLVLETLDDRLGFGVATPDHVLYVCGGQGGAGCCPATEPEEPPSRKPFPPVSKDTCAGSGVMVSVVDTGWWPEAATSGVSSWLAGVEGDVEDVYPDPSQPDAITHYAGHGTFIAGVVRCLAPSTEVRVEGFLTHGGAIFESEMVAQLVETMALGPDIISLSAGTVTRGHGASLAFQVFYENYLSQVKNTVLVAAAGNDSTRAPFWPAAFPWTISVGATNAAGARADYSNFGSWVDLYARGSDLVNAFPTGTYTCSEPPHAGEVRTFKGMAQWSGTSFSTPVVAGLIAARMSATGLSARHAAEQLMDEARAGAVPGIGPFLPLP